METKTITVIKLYFLHLHPRKIRNKSFTEIVAASTDYQKLVDWYNAQLNPEGPETVVFNDTIDSGGSWLKYFKNGSPIEWYNPATTLKLKDPSFDGHGINAQWVNVEEFNALKKFYKESSITWIEEE